MEFNSNKPIYLQISELVCEKILSGEYPEEARILSVRELGAEIGVNPNTVMRAYERLTAQHIIYNKRGIGYFISPEARKMIQETQKADFLEQELPHLVHRMKLLGIRLEEVQEKWTETDVQSMQD